MLVVVVVFLYCPWWKYQYLSKGTYTSSTILLTVCTLILLFLSHSSYFNRKHLVFLPFHQSDDVTTSTNFSSVVVIITTMHFTYYIIYLLYTLYYYIYLFNIYLSLCKTSLLRRSKLEMECFAIFQVFHISKIKMSNHHCLCEINHLMLITTYFFKIP